MTDEQSLRERVGEINPSQLMYAHGIGAIVELPNLSVMVMGIDDWQTEPHQEIREDRLLEAVKFELGHQVQKMFAPPVSVDESADLAIVGTGFEQGAQVLVGGTTIGVLETRSELIKASVGAGEFDVGTYDLIVTNPDGETDTFAEAVEFTAAESEGTGSSGSESGGCGCTSGHHGNVPFGALLLGALALGMARLRRR